MTRINRQTYRATLPDGTVSGIVSGTIGFDDSASPYIEANGLVIPTPSNPAILDPRSVGAAQPPRVLVEMFQEFSESASLLELGTEFPTLTLAGMGALYPTQTLAQLGALFTTEWNSGNDWEGRLAVSRHVDLAILDATGNDDGTTTLALASDEAYTLTAAGTQLAGWAALGVTRLFQLVSFALAAIMPVRINRATDYDLSAAIAASPSQPVYTETVDGGLDTYVQLASARLFCDESRVWHLDPNTLPTIPSTFYSQGFESALDSWSPGARSTTYARTGTRSLKFSTALVGSTWEGSSSRTLSGLTVGYTYTVSVWCRASGHVNANVTAVDPTSGDTLDTAGTVLFPLPVWSQVSISFVAVATTCTLTLAANSTFAAPASTDLYWDDILVTVVDNHPDVQLVHGDTLTQFTDGTSRSAADWANQVKIVYNWTTGAGAATSQVDFADGSTPGVPGAQYVQTNDNTPYPGAGAAAATLARTISYGHEATMTAVTDLAFNPRQLILAVLPSGNYLGTIGAVEFDLAAKTMNVTTRNLA